MESFLQNLIIGVQLGSIYALVALGYTMVYGVLRLINFAHSDVLMIGAYVGFYLSKGLQMATKTPTWGGGLFYLFGVTAVAMVVCAALGLIIERLAYRPLRKAPKLTALITAIGVSLFLENGAQLLFGSTPLSIPDFTPGGVVNLTPNVVLAKDSAILVLIAIVLMVGLTYIVQKTRFGKAMRAVSMDTDAASLMGIPTDFVISGTFALGAALAGAGGVLLTVLQHNKIEPLMGLFIGLKAFIAAVVGGIGSIPGAMLGGLLLGISEAFIKGSPLSGWSDAAAFAILIIVLLVRPAGLLGKFAPEKV
jgi:branched-chain amino acid transport system permease protein